MLAKAPAEPAREFELTGEEFDRLRKVVRRITGIALTDAKRALVYGRLSRRLRKLGLRSFSQYCRLIEGGDPRELQELTNAITTNLTAFFREPHHFERLARDVLTGERASNRPRRIRIWSAGCATGEEAYSIAMTVHEALGALDGWDVKILATDIDTHVIERAARGVFEQERAAPLSAARRARWFRPLSGASRALAVAPELRRLITFKALNLLDPWPMRGPFDAIFCRNVSIYFDHETQIEIFNRMAGLQSAGGWLFIGHSETLHAVTPLYRLLERTAYRKA